MVKIQQGRTTPRSGFTLVEMLVSTALIIFVMLILTTVFTAGLQALRNMRGVGALQDQLRQAATVMRKDLSAPHFSREETGLFGPYLSQQRMDLYDWTPPKEGFFRIWQGGPPINEGNDRVDSFKIDPTALHYLHFTVRNEPGPGQGSGRDRYFATDSFAKALALTAPETPLSAINFSTIMGTSSPDYLSGNVLYYSSWAEIAYFVRTNGQFVEQDPSKPLFTLFRRRRILVDSRPPNSVEAIDVSAQAAALPDVSITQPFSLTGGTGPPRAQSINIPSDVTKPNRRFGMNPQASPPPTSPSADLAGVVQNQSTIRPDVPYSANAFYPLYNADPSQVSNPRNMANGGDDVLLDNVLSFDVKAAWDVPTDRRFAFDVDTGQPLFPAAQAFVGNPPTVPDNTDFPFDILPLTARKGNSVLRAMQARVFDTWSNQGKFYGDTATGGVGTGWRDSYSVSNGSGAPQTVPLRIRVKAIQIRLRVWDAKTQQTRQITIIQDL